MIHFSSVYTAADGTTTLLVFPLTCNTNLRLCFKVGVNTKELHGLVYFHFDLDHSVTKSGPEVCDLHGTQIYQCFHDNGYILRCSPGTNINLAPTSVWQCQPRYGG